MPEDGCRWGLSDWRRLSTGGPLTDGEGLIAADQLGDSGLIVLKNRIWEMIQVFLWRAELILPGFLRTIFFQFLLIGATWMPRSSQDRFLVKVVKNKSVLETSGSWSSPIHVVLCTGIHCVLCTVDPLVCRGRKIN